MRGSVLAPLAHVTLESGVLDGSLIAASASGDGEFNNIGLDACVDPSRDLGDGSGEYTFPCVHGDIIFDLDATNSSVDYNTVRLFSYCGTPPPPLLSQLTHIQPLLPQYL